MAVALIFTGFTRHPKILRAGVSASWLFVCCLEYAAEHRRDGLIPTEAISTFGSAGTKANIKRLLYSDDRLGPLLHETPEGYLIHDYLGWNRRAAQLAEAARAKSEARSKAGRKGAESRWGGRLTDGNGDGKPMANGVANGSQTDDSGSGSFDLGSVDPSPNEPDARSQDQTGGIQPPPDLIIRARKRAGLWPDRGIDTAWSLAACRRVVQRAAHENSPIHASPADHAQEAWDRLAVLAALDTRSPGRLLEPAGWELAGRELHRIRAEQANRRAQAAEREAQARGEFCDHGAPAGRGCALCRTAEAAS